MKKMLRFVLFYSFLIILASSFFGAATTEAADKKIVKIDVVSAASAVTPIPDEMVVGSFLDYMVLNARVFYDDGSADFINQRNFKAHGLTVTPSDGTIMNTIGMTEIKVFVDADPNVFGSRPLNITQKKFSLPNAKIAKGQAAIALANSEDSSYQLRIANTQVFLNDGTTKTLLTRGDNKDYTFDASSNKITLLGKNFTKDSVYTIELVADKYEPATLKLYVGNVIIPNGDITVNYLDQDGAEIIQADTISGDFQAPYTATPKEIPGYIIVAIGQNAKGTHKDYQQTVIFTYKKNDGSTPTEPEKPTEPETPTNPGTPTDPGTNPEIPTGPNQPDFKQFSVQHPRILPGSDFVFQAAPGDSSYQLRLKNIQLTLDGQVLKNQIDYKMDANTNQLTIFAKNFDPLVTTDKNYQLKIVADQYKTLEQTITVSLTPDKQEPTEPEKPTDPKLIKFSLPTTNVKAGNDYIFHGAPEDNSYQLRLKNLKITLDGRNLENKIDYRLAADSNQITIFSKNFSKLDQRMTLAQSDQTYQLTITADGYETIEQAIVISKTPDDKEPTEEEPKNTSETDNSSLPNSTSTTDSTTTSQNNSTTNSLEKRKSTSKKEQTKNKKQETLPQTSQASTFYMMIIGFLVLTSSTILLHKAK